MRRRLDRVTTTTKVVGITSDRRGGFLHPTPQIAPSSSGETAAAPTTALIGRPSAEMFFHATLARSFIQSLRTRGDDDFVDRLNYYYTPIMLCIACLIISAKQVNIEYRILSNSTSGGTIVS